jgi:predicted secreted protein
LDLENMKKGVITILGIMLFSCNTQKGVKADYEVVKDSIFELKLKSNPTTGYSWKWIKNKDSKRIDSINSTYLRDTAAPGMTGVGGYEIWKFKGKESGVDTLTFEYCRPWDPKSVVETKKIIVLIK